MKREYKVGLAITTFNAEDYFSQLFDTIPFDRLDEVVIVNGGEPYKKDYPDLRVGCDFAWLQHKNREFASVARNDGTYYLEKRGMDYIFTCEDDMLIKHPDIFDAYIDAHKKTGLHYFCFASNAWGAGEPTPETRTPRFRVQYDPELRINFYANMCNEFTFRTKELWKETGEYNQAFNVMFDVDMVYRTSLTDKSPQFGYFPDIWNSDNYIQNNPNAVSRMNPNGERDKQLQGNADLFKQIHGKNIWEIIPPPQAEVVEKLKKIKEKYAIH